MCSRKVSTTNLVVLSSTITIIFSLSSSILSSSDAFTTTQPTTVIPPPPYGSAPNAFDLRGARRLFHSHSTPVRRHGSIRRRRMTGSKLYSRRRRQSSSTSSTSTDEPKEIVIIGGGWAGYSVAESLSSTNPNSSVRITLLDAAARPDGGLAGSRNRTNKTDRPVEAGIHGFWREYRNTFEMMGRIEGVEVGEVLGDYGPSVLFSKEGRVALAPVLGDDDDGDGGDEPFEFVNPADTESIKRAIAKNLPPPLDLPLMAQFSSNSRNKPQLSPIDLASAIGLLGAWADFQQESPTSWKRYDSLPATALFTKSGITSNLFHQLVSPLLHVLPMCPAYDCSAAAALSCFHVFALQSRGAFDVRWCRGNIGEMIFEPWRRQLEGRGVVVKGGSFVTSIESGSSSSSSIDDDDAKKEEKKYTLGFTKGESIKDVDAIVLAIGATSMKKMTSSSKLLSSLPTTKGFDELRGVTCVAVRLFLKPDPETTSGLKGGTYDRTQLPPDLAEAMVDSPIAVCGPGMGGAKELEETGFCIYDLQRMHDEFRVVDTSSDNDDNDEDGKGPVAVLEVDYYRADDIANMSDDEIIKLTLKTVAATFGTPLINERNVLDHGIVRARNAVSHFVPGSALLSPDVRLDDDGGMYVCGDWVDRCGHASWSTEKSVVTAKRAAKALCEDLGLDGENCGVVPAAKDTRELGALRELARLLRTVAPPKTIPPSPWVFAKQLLEGKREI